MKKLFAVLTVSAFLFTAPMAFAKDDCDGPDCQASGNFDISTFAATGDFSIDGKIVPNGAAGGLGAAGGIAAGEASGEVESFEVPEYEYVGRGNGDYNSFFGVKYYVGHNKGKYDLVGYKTVMLGETEADLYSRAGAASVTEHYVFHPTGRNSIGVGSSTGNFAASNSELNLGAFGAAEADGAFVGAAGQASLDGSIMTKSLNKPWDSNGLTLGIAGQGSAGAYIGGGIVAGLGSADIEAGLDMWGHSYSESYRLKDNNTEVLGTFVHADTTVLSYGDVDRSLVGVGYVNGGYVLAGGVATKTIQAVNNGVAMASAKGGYVGGGSLNCDIHAYANGYTKTTAQAIGTNGSIVTSSAGMEVGIAPNAPEGK
jgi:hypothetical protein